MLDAIEKHNMMPGEVTPTGANLTMPERGIRARLDSSALEVAQELPVEEAFVATLCVDLAALAQEKFGPLHIEANVFEMKLLEPMKTDDEAELAMLKFDRPEEAGAAKAFDMPLKSRRLDRLFESGSNRLEVSLAPVAFETVRLNRHNPPLNATSTQIERAKRLTAAADRVPQYAPYAIFLELTLTENEPALANEMNLYKMIKQKSDVAKTMYTLK